MSERRLLRLERIIGVAIFALIHFGILFTLQVRVFGAGDERPTAVQTYRESLEGQRDKLIADILEWPVLKPIEMALGPDFHDFLISDLLGWATGRKLRDLSVEPAFAYVVVNSLAWGVGLRLALELLLRAIARLLRR